MKKSIAIAALLVFAAAGLAFAAQRAWGPGGMHGYRGFGGLLMGPRIMALLDNQQFRTEVNLTDDQASRLRQLVTNTEKSNIETRAKMATARIDLRQLLMTDKPDQDAVMKKVQEISDLRGQMMKTSVQALLEAKTILTPEQQTKIRQFIQNRFRGRGWRHSRGRGRMGTPPGGMMRGRPGTPPPPPSTPTPPTPPSQ
ncbi:MAG: Spy/CpxP family protein refolding chaperone [Acidobacteriota bacterium]